MLLTAILDDDDIPKTQFLLNKTSYVFPFLSPEAVDCAGRTIVSSTVTAAGSVSVEFGGVRRVQVDYRNFSPIKQV